MEVFALESPPSSEATIELSFRRDDLGEGSRKRANGEKDPTTFVRRGEKQMFY